MVPFTTKSRSKSAFSSRCFGPVDSFSGGIWRARSNRHVVPDVRESDGNVYIFKRPPVQNVGLCTVPQLGVSLRQLTEISHRFVVVGELYVPPPIRALGVGDRSVVPRVRNQGMLSFVELPFEFPGEGLEDLGFLTSSNPPNSAADQNRSRKNQNGDQVSHASARYDETRSMDRWRIRFMNSGINLFADGGCVVSPVRRRSCRSGRHSPFPDRCPHGPGGAVSVRVAPEPKHVRRATLEVRVGIGPVCSEKKEVAAGRNIPETSVDHLRRGGRSPPNRSQWVPL